MNRWEGVLWLIQALSGFLLLLLVGIHMIAQHFVVEGGLRTYQAVIDYLSHPLGFLLEVLLLLTVTLHAVLGVRAVILDLSPSKRVLRQVQVILTLIGAGAVLYGLWLLVLIRRG